MRQRIGDLAKMVVVVTRSSRVRDFGAFETNKRSSKTRFRVKAASQVGLEGSSVRAASHWKDLKDPCHIWATGEKSVRVNVSLWILTLLTLLILE